MTAVLLVGWLALGWFGGRHILRQLAEFGRFDGTDISIALLLTAMGPLGLLAAVAACWDGSGDGRIPEAVAKAFGVRALR